MAAADRMDRAFCVSEYVASDVGAGWEVSWAYVCVADSRIERAFVVCEGYAAVFSEGSTCTDADADSRMERAFVDCAGEICVAGDNVTSVVGDVA